jgi:hypothetical protein
MSQKGYDEAIARLKQATRDINWAHAVLRDPTSNLREYDLTEDERQKLAQEFHAHLVISLAPPIPRYESEILPIAPPIPPYESRVLPIAPPIEIAPDIPPYESEVLPIAPPIPPRDESGDKKPR